MSRSLQDEYELGFVISSYRFRKLECYPPEILEDVEKGYVNSRRASLPLLDTFHPVSIYICVVSDCLFPAESFL